MSSKPPNEDLVPFADLDYSRIERRMTAYYWRATLTPVDLAYCDPPHEYARADHKHPINVSSCLYDNGYDRDDPRYECSCEKCIETGKVHGAYEKYRQYVEQHMHMYGRLPTERELTVHIQHRERRERGNCGSHYEDTRDERWYRTLGAFLVKHGRFPDWKETSAIKAIVDEPEEKKRHSLMDGFLGFFKVFKVGDVIARRSDNPQLNAILGVPDEKSVAETGETEPQECKLGTVEQLEHESTVMREAREQWKEDHKPLPMTEEEMTARDAEDSNRALTACMNRDRGEDGRGLTPEKCKKLYNAGKGIEYPADTQLTRIVVSQEPECTCAIAGAEHSPGCPWKAWRDAKQA